MNSLLSYAYGNDKRAVDRQQFAGQSFRPGRESVCNPVVSGDVYIPRREREDLCWVRHATSGQQGSLHRDLLSKEQSYSRGVYEQS